MSVTASSVRPSRSSAIAAVVSHGFQTGLRTGDGMGMASSAASASAGRPFDGQQAGERVLEQPAALTGGRTLHRRVGDLAGGGDVAPVEVAADLERARVRLPDPGSAPHPVLVERGGQAGQGLVELPAPPAPVALPDAGRQRHEQRAAGMRLRPGPGPEVAEVVVGQHPDVGRHHPEQPVVHCPEPVAVEREPRQRDRPARGRCRRSSPRRRGWRRACARRSPRPVGSSGSAVRHTDGSSPCM